MASPPLERIPGSEAFGGFPIQVQHSHFHPGRGQGLAHGCAQHARAAGDDGDFAGKIK